MFYKAQAKYDEALENCFKSLQFFEELGIKTYISYPILTIGEIYVQQAKWREARKYLNQGLIILQILK